MEDRIMIKLDLTNQENSTIKYQIQKFPDGQQNIVIKSSCDPTFPIYNGISLSDMTKYSVEILSRLNNWKDLELIVCAVASLRNLGIKEIHLYVPYILGARSDRKFEMGGNRYIKEVIAPVLNFLNFESVTCIDPHSYVLENCINNFYYITNKRLVEFALFNTYSSSKPKGNFILVSPDAGASHKIYKLAEQIGYKGDIITCSKERDVDGKLTRTVVPTSFDHVGKDFIIIDDIADGGRTFINIAKELKRQFEGSATKNKIYLIVTHGIFSAGFEELNEYFDGIYCTNSYSNQTVNGISNPGSEKIKQLNVF
jgi:ribose-phosphate pyrophosphokinase